MFVGCRDKRLSTLSDELWSERTLSVNRNDFQSLVSSNSANISSVKPSKRTSLRLASHHHPYAGGVAGVNWMQM